MKLETCLVSFVFRKTYSTYLSLFRLAQPKGRHLTDICRKSIPISLLSICIQTVHIEGLLRKSHCWRLTESSNEGTQSPYSHITLLLPKENKQQTHLPLVLTLGCYCLPSGGIGYLHKLRVWQRGVESVCHKDSPYSL